MKTSQSVQNKTNSTKDMTLSKVTETAQLNKPMQEMPTASGQSQAAEALVLEFAPEPLTDINFGF